jgi:hypothetical protein
MDEYSDHDDDNSEAPMEDSMNEFIVNCDGEQYICNNPTLSKVFKDRMKHKVYTADLNFPNALTATVVEFMNTGVLPDNDIPLTDIGNAARVLKIQTLLDALVEPMTEVLRRMSKQELIAEFQIDEAQIDRDRLCLECLWIYPINPQ